MDNLKVMAEASAEQTWHFQLDAAQRLLAALDLTVRVLGTMPGRRMLLLSSSGFLSGDLEPDVDRVIDNALRRDVVINALNAKGLYAEAPGGNQRDKNLEGTFSVSPRNSMYETQQAFARMEAEKRAMTDFAESTGGKFFNNNNDFLHGLNELAAPEVSYLLGFSPHPLKHDGKFHNLKVEVKTTGHIRVYARKGYFAPADEKTKTAKAGAASASDVPPSQTKISVSPTSKAPAITPAGGEAAAPAPAPTEATSETPAQPANDASKAAAAPPQPQPGPASASASSAPLTAQPPSAEAAAEITSKRAFLNRASREVGHYIQAFADLTTDETRVMQSFDERGFADKLRSMQSALVVYRLRNDAESVLEYRDVISIDGHEVKGHAARATKLWREMAAARSLQEEARRLKADSERYDIGLEETGLTVFEGLPLRSRCAGDFTFREVRHEIANGRPVRVFAYRQVRPCSVVTYHFALPPEFADSAFLHGGELTLDAETGQVVREERNVYAGRPGENAPRVAHITLGYTDSPFGILVPKTIEIETFVPRVIRMTNSGFGLHARTVQTYGPFSRFEVSVGEKVSAPVP